MENIPDNPEGILLEILLEGFEHTNGHNKIPGGILPSGVCFFYQTLFTYEI